MSKDLNKWKNQGKDVAEENRIKQTKDNEDP